MDKENEKRKGVDPYEDFLSDISDQFAGKEEEQHFLDSIGVDESGEDIQVEIGVRVKNVRESRGLTIKDISQRTGIETSVLEQIEDGSFAPPLGTIIKLAKSLEMKIGYFISGEEDKAYTIVRRNDRKVVSRYDSKKGKRYGYEYFSLAPHKKDRHMEPFMVTLVPTDTDEERSAHDGQEFIYVLDGTMEVRIENEVHIIEAGDAIYYDSTVPHLVKCRGDKPTRILAVLYAER
jgi:quercetin dioxygenase-like cupin family protein/ribosome-binding protein aMBF1 (putative translation factor)